MATNILGLEQPEYLSDGETGINAYKTNFAKIDNIYTYCIVDRISGNIITDRATGQPILSRLTIATGG